MLDVNPEDAIIVAAISQLARNLNLSLVAEGVETTVQRDQVAALGCDLGQG